VPKHRWTEETLPPEERPHVYSYAETNLFSHLARTPRPAPRIPKALEPLRKAARSIALRCTGFRPLPEYDRADNPGWLLLRAILQKWIADSPAPVLLFPIPHYASFVSSSNPTRYPARFRELARDTGCHLYDPLSDLLALPAEDRLSLWCDWSGHLSPTAHEVMARLLTPRVRSLMQAAPGRVAVGQP
jgi:hypothetical protein